MADKEALLGQFMTITGVDTERANFYLEAAGWNMDVAMGSFYDTEEGDQEQREAGEVTGAPAAQDTAARGPPEPVYTKPTPRSGIQTIQGLQMDDASDDSDEEGQAFFAGGSETSGQQILGPRRRRGEDIVKEMFNAARGHGAEEVEPSSEAGSATPASFGGAGYRLGQTSLDTEVVPAAPDRQPPQDRTVKLRLWKTGFSVDDGELREYSDPANQQFLSSIRAGQVPQELIRDAQGGEVHLDMEDHRHEDYQQPKVKHRSFAGKGHILGSRLEGVLAGCFSPAGSPAAAIAADTTSTVTAAADGPGWWLLAALTSLVTLLMSGLWHLFSPAPAVAVGATPAAAAPAGDPAESEAAARAALGLDTSQPVTSVQVRLLDGSRLVVQLNHTHTVGQLRQYIVTARPRYSSAPFALMTTFPSKELADDSVSVKDGQLLNAAVLQRAK